jgi:hypothetical protein
LAAPSVSIIKPQPDSVLGFSALVIQGAILSFLFANSRFDNRRVMDAVRFAWCFGVFLVSYTTLTLRPGAYHKTRTMIHGLIISTHNPTPNSRRPGETIRLYHEVAQRQLVMFPRSKYSVNGSNRQK